MDTKIWSDILHPDISILEKIIRPVLVYFFLVIGLRLAGKRELAQLNPFDLIVLLTGSVGPERDHRERQFGDGRADRRDDAVGGQLLRRAISFQAPED